MPNLQIFERGPTKQSLASQNLANAFSQGMQSYQQASAQKQQKLQTQQQQGELAKLLFGPQADQYKNLPAEQQLKAYELQNKPSPGGVTSQPTPPDVSQKLNKILTENPRANAEQLALMADEAGIPRIYSNSIIESRRQIQSDESKKSTDERAFQTQQAKEVKQKVSDLRSSLPRKRMALGMSRDAIESKEIGRFSINNLAERLGIPELKTAKGSQLVAAGKENLLSNIAKVSAKAQNQWLEQRMNSQFPQIGQSETANETLQVMLEGEEKLDKAYLDAYEKLAEEDRKEHKYIQGDTIEDRIYKMIDPENEKIMKEVSFKTRQIYEKEKGINWLKEHLMEKVPKGTLLTPLVANLLKKQFNGNIQEAQQAAEKLGYDIATPEEIKQWIQ